MKNCALMIVVLIFSVGGCIFDSDVALQVRQFKEEIQQTILDANSAAEQVIRLEKVYDEVREKFKAGTLAENAAAALRMLDKARDEWNAARSSYQTLMSHKDKLEVKIRDLHEKYGVPYWQIVLYGLGMVASTLAGGRYAQVGGRLGQALAGIRVLYGAIDNNITGTDRKIVKKAVAIVDNPEVERYHREVKEREVNA